jgi:hypothetical protein
MACPCSALLLLGVGGQIRAVVVVVVLLLLLLSWVVGIVRWEQVVVGGGFYRWKWKWGGEELSERRGPTKC